MFQSLVTMATSMHQADDNSELFGATNPFFSERTSTQQTSDISGECTTELLL